MKIKEIDIYFFSGTGNTYLAAEKIASVLTGGGCKVRLLPIEKSEPSSIDFTKTLGIAFTTACWNTYPFVRKFIKSLPQAFGSEAFIFCTMGDSALKAPAVFGEILKEKGYSIIGTAAFRMPNNFLAIQNQEANLRKISLAMPKIEKFAKELLDGNAKTQSANFFIKFCFAISSFITGLWEKPFSQKMLKLKVKKELCVKCGLCAKLCPLKNIELADYPIFKNKCQICLRGSSYCPKNAIDSLAVIGKKVYRILDEEKLKNAFL